MKKMWFVVLGIVFMILAGWGTYRYFSPSKEVENFRELTVQKGTLRQTVSAAGTIKAFREIEVKSRASGKILRVLTRDGDWVKQGQLLLVLDKFDENAGVAQAEASVRSAKASLDGVTDKLTQAQRAYHQRFMMAQSKLLSTEELLQAGSARTAAEADFRVRKANLAQAQEQLKLAQRRFADTEIRSPISGLVLNKYVEEGQIIASGISSTTGGTSLFTVGDMSKMLVAAEVDEVDVGKLKEGQKVDIQVDAYQKKRFQGVLTHISPKGTNKSTVMVFNIEVDVTDDDRQLLKPGMTASAEILIQEKQDALILPQDAVNTERRHTTWVWVKTKNEFVKNPVRLGMMSDSDVEVVAGLTEGQTVYVRQMPMDSKRSKNGMNPRSMMRTGRMMQRGR